MIPVGTNQYHIENFRILTPRKSTQAVFGALILPKVSYVIVVRKEWIHGSGPGTREQWFETPRIPLHTQRGAVLPSVNLLCQNPVHHGARRGSKLFPGPLRVFRVPRAVELSQKQVTMGEACGSVGRGLLIKLLKLCSGTSVKFGKEPETIRPLGGLRGVWGDGGT